MQNKLSNSAYFNQSWSNFKNGFSDLNGNYWLGNEAIHSKTSSATCELYVIMTFLSNGAAQYVKYKPFSINTEAMNYALVSLTFAGGNVSSDALNGRAGKTFSTFDKDNDADTANNCAALCGGGWWYGSGANIAVNSAKCSYTNIMAANNLFQWNINSQEYLTKSQMWLTC